MRRGWFKRIYFIRRHGNLSRHHISADAKDIIGNVYDFCKREKEGGLKISLNQAKERASTATGVSKRTIERIMRRD